MNLIPQQLHNIWAIDVRMPRVGGAAVGYTLAPNVLKEAGGWVWHAIGRLGQYIC